MFEDCGNVEIVLFNKSARKCFGISYVQNTSLRHPLLDPEMRCLYFLPFLSRCFRTVTLHEYWAVCLSVAWRGMNVGAWILTPPLTVTSLTMVVTDSWRYAATRTESFLADLTVSTYVPVFQLPVTSPTGKSAASREGILVFHLEQQQPVQRHC